MHFRSGPKEEKSWQGTSEIHSAVAEEHNYGKVHELKQDLDAKWKAGHDALEAACTRLRDSLDKVGEDRLLCGGLSLSGRRMLS